MISLVRSEGVVFSLSYSSVDYALCPENAQCGVQLLLTKNLTKKKQNMVPAPDDKPRIRAVVTTVFISLRLQYPGYSK